MKKCNRELTSEDVINAASILVEVNADYTYPYFVTIPKREYPKGHRWERSNLVNIDNDNTRQITIWHYVISGIINGKEVEEDKNSLEDFDGEIEEYSIVIGSMAD